MNLRSSVKKIGTVVMMTLATLMFSAQSVLADDDVPPSVVEEGYYIQKFVVSAYYSPVIGQDYYVTGSFDGDIALNGNGTHGADGTPVYPYMLAAPSKYAFGTQIELPGFGVLEVHDRGGAIVAGADYDRLDIYMGSGDEGLERALEFGKRVVYGKVYSTEAPVITYSIDLNSDNSTNVVVDTEDQPELGSKEDFLEVQKMLKALRYFYGELTGNFDIKTSMALNKFQLDYGIAKTSTVDFAGQYGQKTRNKISEVYELSKKTYLSLIPITGLEVNNSGEEVVKLRKVLKRLGYVENDQRDDFSQDLEDKLISFQVDNKIVNSESDFGAGYFGPKTRDSLREKLLEEGLYDEENIPNLNVLPEDYASTSLFLSDLKLGDEGDEVTRLQQTLNEFKYLDVEPTGYYGELTEHAVLKFKQAAQLIEENEEVNGNFDIKIRKKINDIIIARTFAQYYLEVNTGLIEI